MAADVAVMLCWGRKMALVFPFVDLGALLNSIEERVGRSFNGNCGKDCRESKGLRVVFLFGLVVR